MKWTNTWLMLGALSAPLTAMAQEKIAPPAETATVPVSVTVAGQFSKPGRYVSPSKITLLDAIALAGGLNIAPAKAGLWVLRRGKAISFNPATLLESGSKPFDLENDDIVVAAPTHPTPPRPVALPKLRIERKTEPKGKSFLFNGRKVYVIPLKK